jgi:hypothetical protein
MKRGGASALLLASVFGCHAGRNIDTFAPAQSPGGVEISLALPESGRVRGELLAVQDTAFVVLIRDSLVLVPYRAVDGAQVTQFGQLHGIPPVAEDAANLRLVSRFPQGIAPDLLARLLAAYGQSALKVLAR